MVKRTTESHTGQSGKESERMAGCDCTYNRTGFVESTTNLFNCPVITNKRKPVNKYE